MKVTSRKFSLAILALFLTAKIANACSLDGDYDIANDQFAIHNFYNNLFLFSSLFILTAITTNYFLRGREELWIVIAGIFCSLTAFSTALSIEASNSCGVLHTTKYLGSGLVFLAILFSYQLFSWVLQRRKLKVKLP